MLSRRGSEVLKTTSGLSASKPFGSDAARQERKHDLVVADERVAASRCRRPDGVTTLVIGPIQAHEVEVHGREAVERDAAVARRARRP